MKPSHLNNVRFDLSPYLIHFFRTVDFNGSNVSFLPEEWGPGSICEDSKVSPLFLLRNSVRQSRLWATFSVRKDRRTVYGPDPAVCFTDMPIPAFVESGRARQAKGEAMSPIGIVLPKSQAIAKGARPVIYGLSSDPIIPAGRHRAPRIIPPHALPLSEQYRYVALSSDGSVDWTHEREWRWPCRNGLQDYDDALDGPTIPGFDLDLNGMGIIVRTQAQADKVLHDLLVLSDQEACGRYRFVLVGDNIDSLETLRSPDEVQKALSAATIDLASIDHMSAGERKARVLEFDACVAAVDRKGVKFVGREEGGCWLWLTNASHPITRALRKAGRVTINADGRYLVDVDDFSPDLPLGEREELTRRLAALLEDRHKLSATYHSVLGRFGIDDIPSYSSPPIHDRRIFNYAHDEEDY